MKIVKKLLCVMLSIAMLLCYCFSAAAAEPRISIVGSLVIFVCREDTGTSSSLGTTDHAFISFKNTWTQKIQFGDIMVNPGCEVTVGAWGTLPAKHSLGTDQKWQSGVWYNLESHLMNKHGEMMKNATLIIGLTAADVQTVNNVISKFGSYNVITNNCANLAVDVWNSVAPATVKLSAGAPAQPSTLYENITNISHHQLNRTVMNSTPIGYRNKEGNFVSVTLKCEN